MEDKLYYLVIKVRLLSPINVPEGLFGHRRLNNHSDEDEDNSKKSLRPGKKRLVDCPITDLANISVYVCTVGGVQTSGGRSR